MSGGAGSPEARGCEGDAHGGELAVDAPVAPGGVLVGQSEDERHGARRYRWPTGRPSGVGPASADEVSVPAEQGVGLDEEAPETAAGEQSCQPGEQRPVSRLESRTADLAAEHRHFVAEHDHLDRQLVAGGPRELDQLADAKEEEVEEAERHVAILAALAVGHERQVTSTDGFAVPTGRACARLT
jgi:hypothetical protein